MNIRYYETYEDDFLTTKNQDYILKDNYKWIHHNIIYKITSYILYYISLVISFIYPKIKHVSFKNKNVLKRYSKYIIYANHTLPFGDVVDPIIATFPKRPYFVVSSSNLGIPIIGSLLPALGALPIPKSIHKMKDFMESITYHLTKNHAIIIYPEAHVWPYNTFIRDFPSTSFRFPVDNFVPSFTMVTTYQKRKHSKKPKITIYINGPFYPDKNLSKKEQIKNLHKKIYQSMINSSKNSNYDYIKYVKKT